MPFVRIDTLTTDGERLAALGRAVHDALVETIGIPPNDRFQVLTGHDGASSTLRYEDYLGVTHDDDMVFVAITMRSGRTSEQKQALYRRIAELAKEYAGTDPRNVLITLTENEPIDWSFGNGGGAVRGGGRVTGTHTRAAPAVNAWRRVVSAARRLARPDQGGRSPRLVIVTPVLASRGDDRSPADRALALAVGDGVPEHQLVRLEQPGVAPSLPLIATPGVHPHLPACSTTSGTGVAKKSKNAQAASSSPYFSRMAEAIRAQ